MKTAKVEVGGFKIRVCLVGDSGDFEIEEILVPPGLTRGEICAALERAAEEQLASKTQLTIDAVPLGCHRVDDRKGEIALAFLKQRMRKEGLELRPRNFRGEVGNIVKELNQADPGLDLSINEALEFARELAEPLIQEMFAPQPERTEAK